jgi:hypothetical protein
MVNVVNVNYDGYDKGQRRHFWKNINSNVCEFGVLHFIHCTVCY